MKVRSYLGFFASFSHSALLAREFVQDVFAVRSSSQNLDCRLNERLTDFGADRFEDPAHVSPIMNFSYHSLKWFSHRCYLIWDGIF